MTFCTTHLRQGFLTFIILFSWTVNAQTSGFDIELSKSRCDSQDRAPAISENLEVYQSDFHWGYSIEEMESDFWTIYNSGKRLRFPANYDSKAGLFQAFLSESKKPVAVPLTANFIQNVTLHIEEALGKTYAEFIFFPDMGHSHLYLDEKNWIKNYQNEDGSLTYEPRAILYSKMLADPGLQALYHTAEQLEMKIDNVLVDDEYLQFRYWHRNPVGLNDGSGLWETMPVNLERNFNTVGSLPGMKSWSAGFEISSSKDGCFAYRTPKGQLLFFDIGLIPLQMDPSLPMGDDMY